MDSAQCSLVFESYSYNTATVTINWMPTNAVTLRFNELSETDYQLTYTKYYKHVEVRNGCGNRYFRGRIFLIAFFFRHRQYYKAGEWYRLTAEIGFRRRYGYYILQVINKYQWTTQLLLVLSSILRMRGGLGPG